MKALRLFLLLLAGAAATARGAVAPASLAGKVFHASGGFTGSRFRAEMIIFFSSDGHCSFLKYATGSFISQPAMNLESPPADGTYIYVPGAATAIVTLQESGGTLPGSTGGRTGAMTLGLNFTDDVGGTYDYGPANGTFYLNEIDALPSAPVINISLRTAVAGGRTTIAGFVAGAPTLSFRREVDLLVRVVGPSLAQFNVSPVWQDTAFTVAPGNVTSLAYYADWDANPTTAAAIRKISSQVGAFTLQPGSREAVAVVRVEAGAHTIICTPPVGDTGGEALIEVYVLP